MRVENLAIRVVNARRYAHTSMEGRAIPEGTGWKYGWLWAVLRLPAFELCALLRRRPFDHETATVDRWQSSAESPYIKPKSLAVATACVRLWASSLR